MRYYKKNNKVYRAPIKLEETKEIVEKTILEDGSEKEIKKIITVYTSDETKILEAGFEIYQPSRRRPARPVRRKQNKAERLTI